MRVNALWIPSFVLANARMWTRSWYLHDACMKDLKCYGHEGVLGV